MGRLTYCRFFTLILATLLSTGYASDFPFSIFSKSPYTGALYSNKTAEYEYLNETECARKCLYAHTFECVAFEFDFVEMECFLVSSDDVTMGVNATENKGSHYYTKITGLCPNPPVGLEDGTVALSQISMSSILGGEADGPIDISRDNVRLNSPGGWCAGEGVDINNITDWIQIDFNEPKVIGAVATQGFNHPDVDDIFCSQYYLSYRYVNSSYDSSWVTYEEGSGTKLFDGNTNKNGIVNNTLSMPVTATSMRLQPTACQNHPCMRIELYGCRSDCEPNPCVNATCTDDNPRVWNVTCDCPPGMTGDFCQVNIDECASNPCQNGATCVDRVDYYTCTCLDGFEGYDCQTNTDECVSNPCQNNGTCADEVNGYNCTCADGYTGVNCDIYDVNCTEGHFPGVNSCYMLEFSNDTTYHWAERVCRAMRGHLVYLDNAIEQGIVSDILVSEGVSNGIEILTGLRYDSSSSAVTFGTSSDGPVFDGWASSSPSGSDGCVAMVKDGSSWAWSNVGCSSDYPYICEQEKTHGNFSDWGAWEECSVTCGPGQGVQYRRRTCTNPAPLIGGDVCVGEYTQNRTCGTICPIVECPPGFITKYDTCYLLRVNETATYADAKADCQNLTVYGGHLLFVNSIFEEAFMASIFAEKYVDDSLKYYTGLQIDVTNSSLTFDWRYGEGQELNSSSWANAGSSMWANWSPSNESTDDQCILMQRNGSSWKLVNEECTQSLGYVCEVNMADGSLGSWLPWGECNSTCGSGYQTRTRLCTDPAPVLGGANCTGITEQTQSCNAPCPNVTCPAGFSTYTDSCFIVLDASYLYTDQNSARKDCITMTNGTGHLAYVQSYEELEFIGYRLEDSYFGYERMPVYVGLTQDGGVLSYANSSLTVNVTGWSSDRLWARGYPSADNRECVAMVWDEEGYQWLLRDVACHRQLGYVCEITQTAGNWGSWLEWSRCDATCGNGTQIRKRVCDDPAPILDGDNCVGSDNETRSCTGACDIVTCPSGFETYYDSCYKFFVNASDATSMANANVTCKDLTNDTGRVVRVDRYDEQFYLNWALKDAGVLYGDRIFIGHLYDSSSQAMLYYGSSGNGPSDATWPNNDWWARSYPRNAATKECVALVYDHPTQEWLFGDVSCDDSYGFICEISQAPGGPGEWGAWSQCTDSCGNGTQIRTRECNDPAPILEGQFCSPSSLNDTRSCEDRCPIVNCPPGWIAGYSSCYKLVSNGNETYSSANDTCTTLTNDTGHLFYVNDQTELDEVSWILKKLNYSETLQFLTGLVYQSDSLTFDDNNGSPDSSSWRTSEEAPWVKHQPSGAGSCVRLAYNSRTWEWRLMDADCEESKPYICEITQTPGNWGGWGDWSSCSQTCDEAQDMGTRHRNRTCSNPAPILGGDYCEGNRTEYGPCGSQCPPQHGGYSDWVYAECSVSCYTWNQMGIRYGGFVNRTRNCTNPAPRYGGDNCSALGEPFETVSCGTEDGNSCPDGIYQNDYHVIRLSGKNSAATVRIASSNYSGPYPNDANQTWIVAADFGKQVWIQFLSFWLEKDNDVLNIYESAPGSQLSSLIGTYSGISTPYDVLSTESVVTLNFLSDSSETREGFLLEITQVDESTVVDGNWGSWSNWTGCNITCGNGFKIRTRECDSPAPYHGGNYCSGNGTEYDPCSRLPCAVNGSWTDWTAWSQCSQTCVGGSQFRSRNCSNPAPAHNGTDCVGDDYEQRNCSSNVTCPIHGGWTEWSDWTTCTILCGGNGTQTRNRSCSNPTPAYGGTNCSAAGPSEETQTCGTHECPIDGSYGDWQSWSACSINCGEGGIRYRYRACDNPVPQYGGADCNLSDLYITETCDSTVNCSSARESFVVYRATSQSSTAVDGDSYRAVDNNFNGTFGGGSCIETNVESAPWWQVDLGGVYKVRGVTIYVRTDDCSDCTWSLDPFVVRLGVSNVPGNNVRCGNVVDFFSNSIYDVDCGLMAGRYLSIQSLAQYDTALSFCEVVVDIGPYAFFKNGSGNVAFANAKEFCREQGAELATENDLLDLYYQGTESCDPGWIEDFTTRYVVQTPSAECGGVSGSPGVANDGLGTVAMTSDAYCTQRTDGEPLISSLNLLPSGSSSQPGLDGSKGSLYGTNDTEAWVPVNSTDGEWVMIDFGAYVSVKGIATRGRPCCDGNFVSGYYLAYSMDGKQWTYYGSGATKLIQGNVDNTNIVRHSLQSIDMVRYLRIEPKTWNTSIAMRAEVYGTVQPANGEFSEWGSWGACSVDCEATGTQQRTRSCDNPSQQDPGRRCSANKYRDQLVESPMNFFKMFDSATTPSNGASVSYASLSAENCAILCFREQSFYCASFQFSKSDQMCELTNTSVTFHGESATSSPASDTTTAVPTQSYTYYEIDYTSCNVHYIIQKARGQSPSDGIYPIVVDTTVYDAYCDMTRDGGGWTLVLTAASADGWDSLSVLQRNESLPSLTNDYSILTHADTIKDSGTGTTFKYRLESVQRGSWGGIYEVPSNYSFTNQDSSQTATLVERFSYWKPGNGSLQHIMPWLTSDNAALLRAHNNTDATSSWAGTLVCDCSSSLWSPYTNWYVDPSADVTTTSEMTTEGPTTPEMTTEGVTTAEMTTLGKTTAEFTTGEGTKGEFTTGEFTTGEYSTDESGSRRRRAIELAGEGDEEFEEFKYIYRIGESLTGTSRRKRSAQGSDPVTFGTVWYWLKEDHHTFQPSIEVDLSGRCWHDSDIQSCGTPCPDKTVPATDGAIQGIAKSTPTLESARDGAQKKCAMSLENNYVEFSQVFDESCLYNPSLCAQGFTIAFWVKVTASGTVDEVTYIYSSSGMQISVSDASAPGASTANLQLEVTVEDDFSYTVSNDTVPDSEWFHVVVTYKRGQGLQLYFNGDVAASLAASLSAASAISESLTNVYFGGDYVNATESAYDVSLTLSDFQVYFRRMSTLDAQLLYLGSNADTQGQTCGQQACPINGGWSTFNDSSPCSVYCGSGGVKEQTRECNNPTPQYGGNDCVGDTVRYVSCSGLSCTADEDTPLGVESGNITDSYLSESACSANNDSCATWARLNDADDSHCWMPDGDAQGHWLQIELETPVWLKGVATTGNPSGAGYVTEYTVATSSNGYDWDYTNVLRGNFDNTTLVRQNVSSNDVSYVRFYPVNWTMAICMRVEIYGVYLPVDGRYSRWGEWSECNVTCGGGIQSRNRSCDNPAPKYGGQTCQDSPTKTRECNTQNCPIDGGWSSWSTVVNCSVACGSNGIKQETRECNNPRKRYGGIPCGGIDSRWVSCDSTVTCSGTEETELGIVNSDIADSQFAESSCTSGNCGNTARVDSATNTDCWMPVNSTNSEWLEVNLTDSVTLSSVAIQGRSQDDSYVTSYFLLYADNETAGFEYYRDQYGLPKLFQGNVDNTNIVRYDLEGLDKVTFVRFEPQSWNGSVCMRVALYGIYNPINGSYGEWTSWNNCSTTCGGGTQSRTRVCNSPAPQYLGRSCIGANSETQNCSTNPCPIDGGLSAWYDVTPCTVVSCGTLGTKQQARNCSNPEPQYGGDFCHGRRQQWVRCDTVTTCSGTNDYALNVADTTNSEITLTASTETSSARGATYGRLDLSDANAAWMPADSDNDPWLQVELPDLVNMKRVAVQGRDGSEGTDWVETFSLAYRTNDTEWAYYPDQDGSPKIFQGNYDGAAAVYNELDPMVANITHVRFYPLTYNGSIALRVELYGIYNPRDGEWTEWSAWSACSVTCAGSTETRTRTCTNPTPRYGGADCPAAEPDSEVRNCNTDPCPIDGDWTAWTDWANIGCSISCGTDGIKHRTRTCTNPPTQYGGAECTNPTYTEEFLACDATSTCGECYEPLGMYDGRIADSQIGASNTKYNDTNLASHGRIETSATGALCWEGVAEFNETDYRLTHDIDNNATVSYNASEYWLQIDFVTPIKLSMVGIQGGGTIERWVTYYNVSLTTDGVNWYNYEESGETVTYYGNIDKSTIVRSTLSNAQENIKGMRIIPVAWVGDGPCMRVEAYGCYNHDACNDALASPSTSLITTGTSDPDYVKVDLGSLQKVTQIRASQTGQDWIQGYYFYFSQNDFDWALYMEDGVRKDFLGNYDADTTVTNPLLNPIHARYLKVVPTSVSISTIVTGINVFTCSATVSLDSAPESTICFTPFGFADRTFNISHRMSASSVYPSSDDSLYLPEYARLHNPSDVGSGLQGWISDDEFTDGNYSSSDQWYQVDFESRVTITGLALQGVLLEGDMEATFDRFSLWFSEDAVDWKPMMKMDSTEVKILDGPTTGDMVVLYELTDDLDSDLRPLDLRYLRIKAEFNTTDSVGLRLEIYGCPARVATECRDGWAEFQTSCYKVYTEGKPRHAAKKTCENEGAHLATITSLDEQKFLRKYVRAYTVDEYNVGFRRYGQRFRWIDDTYVVYTSWAEGEPLYDRFKKCVALSKSTDGKWVSTDCDNKIGFVCEYEREYTNIFACGENTVSLHCPDNQKVNITGGDWGRTMDWEVCPQVSTFRSGDTPCSSEGTLHYAAIDQFAEDCSNVTHCSLLADTSTLGYPCSTSNMHLHINLTYTCVEYMKYARACEGDFLEISCPATSEVIHIMDAMYGRTLDNSVCPGPDRSAPTNCTLPTSISEVRTYCEGQHSCKIAVEVEAFTSDPCNGVAKYLDVNYTCVSGAPVITDEYSYQGDCEAGWTKHDSRCIKGFPDKSKTFHEADEKCNSLHGHLAGVPGDHTQSFLKGLMTNYADVHFWIGCVKTKNNTCRWRDGIGHVYTDFNAGYISDGKERCIHLSADHDFQWEDARCSDTNAFICQQDCVLTFGMEDKTIRNDQLEVSSTKMLSSLDSFKWDGRLNDPYGAWVASDKETQQWFQIDFERVMRVRKFATQGHPRYDYWVSHYALDYTVNDTLLDDGTWNTYEEEGQQKVFSGNNDSSTIVYQYLQHFMYARFLRVLPLNWTNEIALRLEVYGCFLEDNKPEVLEVTNSTKLHYEYNGTIQCLAFGMPLPNITWIRDGYDYEGNENATIVSYALDDHHVVSEIRFHPLWDDRGFYTCVARNQHGSDRGVFYNEKGTPLYLGGKIVCDDDDLVLSCPTGEYIQITDAFYGRWHNEECIIYDDYYPTDCEYDSDTVMYRMQRQCDKKEHCVIHTSEAMFGAFGDNYTKCDGFTKYINMTYECIGYEWTQWFNTDTADDDAIEDESHLSIYKLYPSLCADPQDADCRRASDGVDYYTVADVLQRPCTVNNEGGLLCYNSDQTSGTCDDYEVSFLCPEEELGIWGHEKALECDDEELAISCQADYSIKVHRAFYGRREEGLCTVGNNYTYSLDCSLDQETVLKMVQKNCDNKQSCRLNIEFATVLSDPCPEQPKYLDVRFSCERFRSDFARGKAANMSSLATAADVANMTTDYIVEVDCSEGWCTQSADEYEPWWVVDLQATYEINVVTVYTCDSQSDAASLDNFQVRIGNSTDINFNEDCGEVVTSARPGQNAVFCNDTMRGRYVSIQLMGRTDSIQICEVTVQKLGPWPTKAIACDDQPLELSCSVSEVAFLQIHSAFYGRRQDGRHCPHRWANHTYDTNCQADSSAVFDIVHTKCHNERKCTIDVTTDIFDSLSSDPCQDEYKYLEVEYTCSKFREGNKTLSTTYAVCKEEDLQMACYGSNRFIEITSASYKPVTTTAPAWCTETPSDNTASCSSQDVMSVVAAQCDNKVTCTVRADAYFLGASRCTTHKMQLEVTYDCKDELPTGEITLFGCEGLDAELSVSCPDGTYISITDAFYGRTQVGATSYVCPAADGNDASTTCRSTDTQAIVESYCQEQRTCSIPVDGHLLSSTDPCSSISSKYLQVSYECLAGRPLNDITMYACEDHDSLSVECPEAYPHVRILEAEYGRTEGEFRCAYRENLPSFTQLQTCDTTGVLDAVRTICTNERNCTVPSHWDYYVDQEPCVGTYKYLKITYRCLMGPIDYTRGYRWYFTNPHQDLKNYALANHRISSNRVRNFLECVNKCLSDITCASFNYKDVWVSSVTNGYPCQLNNMIADEVPADFSYVNGFEYYEKDSYRVR